MEDQQYARLVKETVAKDATPQELQQFLHICKQYDLDPLSGEIVFTRRDGRNGKEAKVSFITTRDGYLRVAMRDPNFIGLQSMPVKEGDSFEVCLADSEKPVQHSFGPKRGKLLGAYAIAQHKGRSPVVFWADFDEYFKASQSSLAWQKYPSAMIQKVAEVGALRRQFNITGLVASEEIEGEGVFVNDGINLTSHAEKNEGDKRKTSSNDQSGKEAAEQPREVENPKPEQINGTFKIIKTEKVSVQGKPALKAIFSNADGEKLDIVAVGDQMALEGVTGEVNASLVKRGAYYILQQFEEILPAEIPDEILGDLTEEDPFGLLDETA